MDKKKKGPDAERLNVDDEKWEDAVKKALKKKRPKDGWPKPEKKKTDKES